MVGVEVRARLGEDRLELVFYNCVSPAEGKNNLRLKLSNCV